MRWGLVPAWSRDLSMSARMINARAETLAERPAFRQALRSRRCLIAADGFYEWQSGPGSRKRPCYVSATDGAPLTFAGLWERWENAADGVSVFSCAIITVPANEILQRVHNRMPAILDEDAQGDWLGGGSARTGSALDQLQPAPAERLRLQWVSPFVNSVGNDGPSCIEPLPTAV